MSSAAKPLKAWLSLSMRGTLGRGGGAEDRVEHAGEARLEIVDPQRVEPRAAVLALADHAGLAQDLEVMGAGRLRDRHVQAAARPLPRREVADHLQAHGIAERVQDGAQLELVAGGVGKHLGHDCTTIIVLLLRYDTHRTKGIHMK